MKKKIILFMPFIQVGGVEKNLFLISNYLSRDNQVYVCSGSKKLKEKFNKNIKFISPKRNLNHMLNKT